METNKQEDALETQGLAGPESSPDGPSQSGSGSANINPESSEEQVLADDLNFDVEGSEESGPEPTPKTETEDAGQAESEEDSLAKAQEYVAQVDAFMNSAGAATAEKPTQQEVQAPNVDMEKPIEFVTAEQAEELLADPSKLNDVLNQVRQKTLQEARQVGLMNSVGVDMKKAAIKFYADNPHLNKPHIQAKCGAVAQKLIDMGTEWPVAFQHAAAYVTARMRTHPHEFIKGKLPELALNQAKAPVEGAPKTLPPNRPVFAGGGGAARRTVPQKKDVDALQAELNELSVEHAY